MEIGRHPGVTGARLDIFQYPRNSCEESGRATSFARYRRRAVFYNSLERVNHRGITVIGNPGPD